MTAAVAPRSCLALSVKQPWASMIASGRKTLEMRTWPTRHRGELVICASKSPADQGPTGVTLCLVEVVDCRKMREDDEDAACCPWDPDTYVWEVCVLRQLPPVKVRGNARFYRVTLPA